MERLLANLKALHQQLDEMAVRTKQPDSTEREQRQEIRGPVLVIRGK
jgi:primosomal protein N''